MSRPTSTSKSPYALADSTSEPSEPPHGLTIRTDTLALSPISTTPTTKKHPKKGKKKAWAKEQLRSVWLLRRFNSLALLVSIAAISFGIYAGVIGDNNYAYIAGLSIVIGVILAFISLLGIGSIRQSRRNKMLTTYFSGLVILTAVLLVLSGYVFIEAQAAKTLSQAVYGANVATVSRSDAIKLDSVNLNIVGAYVLTLIYMDYS